LKELFYDHDIQAILEIEIPKTPQEDRLAWKLERNGIFTIWSAYRLAYHMKHQNREQGSSSMTLNGDRLIWNTIWKTDVQLKVRVFSWRVATYSWPRRITNSGDL
jgi:hypothetical protein